MNELQKIYQTLLTRYGDLDWWPTVTGSPYEIIVGAVLTQNTAWHNVEKAISNFKNNLTPQIVSSMNMTELAEIIRPAGFFNQKAVYLKEITKWYAGYNFDAAAVRRDSPEELRAGLLKVKGVGKETADSILLYAFGFPTFVTDAYTVRLCERYPINVEKNYDMIKACFEEALPKSEKVYNNYHALIVINGKNHCRKKPVCNGCPLFSGCKRKNI
ncbi:MAG: endonuclease [Oscillospiraceae bacterium]|nr:endonuclease [Oscillospiraceae bacterium]